MRVLWVIGSVLLFALARCSNKCTYKVFDTVSNAAQTFRIVKYYNWCGYTTSNNINVSVLRNTDSISNEARVVFVAASGVGDQLDRDTTVTFSWVNDSTVMIRHNKGLQIFKKETGLGDVKVRYVLK